jgi:hypothetical protein
MTKRTDLGGSFRLRGNSMTVNRMGYGAMQLAGPQVFGPPRDVDGAIAVLREAVQRGVNHIDTSDYYGPHVTNRIIKQALHPYPDSLVIVTKVVLAEDRMRPGIMLFLVRTSSMPFTTICEISRLRGWMLSISASGESWGRRRDPSKNRCRCSPSSKLRA